MKQNRELIQVWSSIKLNEELIWLQEQEVFPTLLRIAKSCDRILEVGVGKGRMVRILQKRGVMADFCSLDIAKNVKYAPGNRIIGDARALPFKDNSFCLVYSLGVIEHFPEIETAVKEHARVTRRGGYVLVTTPHISLLGLYKKICFFAGNLIKHKRRSFEVVVGKHLTLQQVKNYFMKAHLRILNANVVPPVTPFNIIVKHSVMERPSIAERLIQRILPPNRYGGFLYVLGQKQ